MGELGGLMVVVGMFGIWSNPLIGAVVLGAGVLVLCVERVMVSIEARHEADVAGDDDA